MRWRWPSCRRHLLAYTCLNETAWDALQAAISELFGYRLLRPDTDGAHILADYVHEGREVRLDIASAGRGFQQVLLLLTLLNTRPGAVVLLDQPDAHLHPTLQDTIYRELRSAATRHGSQLIAATHSEVLINAANPSELIAMATDILEDAQRRPVP